MTRPEWGPLEPGGEALNIPETESAELSLKSDRGLANYEHYLRLETNDLAGKKILDLGSGPASGFATELEQQVPGARVISLDYQFETPVDNDPQPPIEKIRGLFTKLPIADQSMDMIVSVGSMPLYLHNQAELEQAFKEVVRVLRKGGSARLGPVTYTDVVSRDPEADIWDRFRKHSFSDTKAIIEPILKSMKREITYEFLPEIEHEFRNPIPGRPRHQPSMLSIAKKAR